MRASVARVSAVVVSSVAVALATLSAVFASLNGFTELDQFTVGAAGLGLMFPLVGALIAFRQPRNVLAWVFIGIGFSQALNGFGDQYSTYGLATAPGSLPGVEILAWATYWTWVPGLVLMLPFAVLLFPDGRLPSRRWRPFAWISAATIPIMAVPLAVATWSLDGIQLLVFVDDLDLPALGPIRTVHTAALVANAAITIAAAVTLTRRMRRADAEARHQLRWFAYAALVVPIGLVGFGFTSHDHPVILLAALPLAAALPVSLGIAVIRYRLYDIDVVISRTLVFGGLAGFITAIYVGIVVGVGSLLGAGDEPDLGLSIVATAVVAVAFQPVRERLTRLANRLVFGKRATPYEVLSRFSAHLGDTVATEQTLERMARLLVDGIGAARAQVWLRLDDRLRPAATWPAHMTDDAEPGHLVDVIHEGETLGALSVDKKRGETMTPADVKLVDDLAAQAGLVLRNLRLTEQLKARIVDLRASRQRLVAAQDEERRRLERDLHDGAQQQIVAMKLKLGIAKTLADREGAPKTVELVDQLAAETDEAVQTLRELAHGIYPPLLAAEGLQAALATHARRAAVPVAVDADGIGRYDPDVEAAVYFCVLEAVSNAAKYASPAQVTIRLSQGDGQLTFEVTDDGVGFDPATTPRGHGLTNMTDRLDALNGVLYIASHPERGTDVTGVLPTGSVTLAGAS